MSDHKPRGRPKTDAALSPGERTRRLIDKADAALHRDTALGPLPDSVLLLALPRAYRARQTDAFTRIAGELSQRLGLSVATTDIPTDPIPVETTDIPGTIPVATTDIPSLPIIVATTDIPGPSKDKAARDRRILELAGIPERRASAILAAEGFVECSPRTVSNVRKRLKP